jgi:hypothetical protein
MIAGDRTRKTKRKIGAQTELVVDVIAGED